MLRKVKLLNKETGKVFFGYLDGEKQLVFEDPERTKPISRESYEYVPETPYELFGIECGDGWSSIIQPILDYIRENPEIEILQIKEKWGGLRIYTGGTTKELDKMIRDAEEESYRVCEICGSREHVGQTCGRWTITICKDCLEKSGNPNRGWKENGEN